MAKPPYSTEQINYSYITTKLITFLIKITDKSKKKFLIHILMFDTITFFLVNTFNINKTEAINTTMKK